MENAKRKPVNVVDLPGHEKLRFRLADHLPKAKAVIFMIDSSTFQKSIRNVGDLLADVLGERSVAKDEINIAILCNKADALMSVNKDRIKSALEFELDRIRTTRTAGVDNQASDGNQDWEYIGLEGTPFSFEQLGNRIDFIELSLKGIAENGRKSDGENKELANLLSFIAEN
ncbi:hypothetical protein HDU97_000629 [Phlyctochytrium planicorne]|nr:hypothetical protein HDU97_000629 [Phlyctochytrium planicorne]